MTAVTKEKVVKPSNLFRKLSAVFLVNSLTFSQATPGTQTSTLAKAGGLPVEFVPNFAQLSNKRILREKLLAGKDVSRELEFNGVELTEEDKRSLLAIIPILKKIGSIGPSYPWLKPDGDFAHIIIKGSRIQRNSYYISQAVCEGIWKKASKYWAGGSKPASHHVKANGSYYADHTITYNPEAVKVGCQTIPRGDVEYIAQNLGWEPNILEEE